jgi:uncharacterized protein (DUF1684 family)
VPFDQFLAEHQEWREYRRSRLVAPGPGPVLWIGLWELHPGATALGADSALPIVLPAAQSPRLAGTLHRSAQEVRFEPAPSAPVRLADGTPVDKPLPLASDLSDSATVLALGSLGLRVHGERGTDRLWLRVWDEEHPARETFALPEEFPPDTNWRVAARLRSYAEPRDFPVIDVAGGPQEFISPGELVFRVRGREHRLVAFAGPTSTSFFVIFRDSTAATTTYEAGRYLRVPFADADGWTTIDFNRAYNAPCVFTPYSTCALPPRENRLALAVAAGEKRAKPSSP